MRFIKKLICVAALVAAAGLSSCHDIEEHPDTVYGNFDALASIVDTRYCFFADKDVDWNEVTERYRGMLQPSMTQAELFDVCAAMLDELRDGHVNLISSFNTSSYRRWWTDYPQDFDLRTIQQYYLDFSWNTTSGIIYKVMEGNIGYLYYPSFANVVGKMNLDYILASFRDCDGLIIDVRDNGGGNLTNIDTFVARFITGRTLGGYICHKTGPGHDDFSSPYPFYYDPAEAGRICWHRPVAVLANRSTFSAANDFVAVMKSLPQVRVVGARTGGGAGMPFSYELSNGWSVRLSASPITSPAGENIEGGIDPSEGFALHSFSDDLARGRDAILDRAIEYLKGEAATSRHP